MFGSNGWESRLDVGRWKEGRKSEKVGGEGVVCLKDCLRPHMGDHYNFVLRNKCWTPKSSIGSYASRTAREGIGWLCCAG